MRVARRTGRRPGYGQPVAAPIEVFRADQDGWLSLKGDFFEFYTHAIDQSVYAVDVVVGVLLDSFCEVIVLQHLVSAYRVLASDKVDIANSLCSRLFGSTNGIQDFNHGSIVRCGQQGTCGW